MLGAPPRAPLGTRAALAEAKKALRQQEALRRACEKIVVPPAWLVAAPPVRNGEAARVADTTGTGATLPVVGLPTASPPGTRRVLRLYEPRWVTLCSQLLDGQEGVTPKVEVRGASGAVLQLRGSESFDAYEAQQPPLDMRRLTSVIPGHGRLDERALFAGSAAFGVCYRAGPRQPLAEVGSLMRIVAFDVEEAGRLVVHAACERRFRLSRVRQERPYVVADVSWLDDGAAPALEEGDADGAIAALAEEAARLLARTAGGDPNLAAALAAELAGTGLDGIAHAFLAQRPPLLQAYLQEEDVVAQRAIVVRALERSLARVI